MSPEELDHRIRILSFAYGCCHFKNGISTLSQISGMERKNMGKILLGCLVGAIPKKGQLAVKSILDFIYLAQYRTHDDITLGYMKDALDAWEENCSYFVEDTHICEDLNIPKFHSLLHYINSIQFLGITDNYNTELFEWLHIDFAKMGWRASNHHDKFPQMVTRLSCQEKIMQFDNYIMNTLSTPPNCIPLREKVPIKLAKYPNQAKTSLASIETSHSVPGFLTKLKEYLNHLLPTRASNQASHSYLLPFNKLDIFHQFKLHRHGLQDDDDETNILLTHIGRVRVIFKLPAHLDHGLESTEAPSSWPQEPLAYIQWYSRLKSSPDEHHGMYDVKTTIEGAIVPLASIRQTCMFIPRFSNPFSGDRTLALAEAGWTWYNVLDRCSAFWVNNWVDMYSYQTIW
ncbi:hypothetical protein L208DRAFT_1264593 [Tricholoma matsutake]|nr:hypothetical protein L208DRAFT_1264593 [Tricholoma matsutake 945]